MERGKVWGRGIVANMMSMDIAGKGIYRHDAEGSDDMPVRLLEIRLL